MNERIRELAEQARLLHKQIGPVVGTRHMKKKEQDLEKFAELIIRECAELTLDHKNDNYYNGWLDYRDEIKKHFGVDE